MVERDLAKVDVAGSSPVSRSINCCIHYLRVFAADVAQSVERVLGKDEVTSSILVIGSIGNRRRVSSHKSERTSHGERKI